MIHFVSFCVYVFAYLLFVFCRERQRELLRPLDGLLMRMIRLLLLKFLFLKILGMRLVVLLCFFVVGVFFSLLICDYIFLMILIGFTAECSHLYMLKNGFYKDLTGSCCPVVDYSGVMR